MSRLPGIAIALVSLVLAPLRVAAATYAGVLPLPGVAWIAGPPPPPAREQPAMHQTMRAFVPDLLVVPTGTSVTFPNDDPFDHSVYSESAGNAFDIGLEGTGPGKSVRFAAPGIVDVRCHVHGSMHAVIVVVDGPYARTTRPGQHFRLTGLRPGRRVLYVWTQGGSETTRTVVVK
jgi:plastocyanin